MLSSVAAGTGAASAGWAVSVLSIPEAKAERKTRKRMSMAKIFMLMMFKNKLWYDTSSLKNLNNLVILQ